MSTVSVSAGSTIGTDEKIRALEVVLQSDAFARSERLKGLLRFLCEAEIEGRESELTEYMIGTRALGRPPDFAPLEDSSVRSRVYELRQKLEKYYEHEAPSAALRIELRKGSYAPKFRLVQVPNGAGLAETIAAAAVSPAPTVSPSALPRLSAPAGKERVAWIVASAFAAGVIVTLVALAVWSGVARPGTRLPGTHLAAAVPAPPVWTPELEALWRPFTADGTPLIIAFETRFFVRLGPLMVRDWNVNSMGSLESSDALMQVKRLFNVNQIHASRNYSDSGDPAALFYLTRLLGSRIRDISLKNALDVTSDDLRGSNVIYLGKPWTDPQIGPMLSRAELVDANGKIVNIHPVHGEQAEYEDRADPADPDRWGEKYSVITMMPGPSGGRRVLTLTGSGSELPSALAWYVTNPDAVRSLLMRMHLGSNGSPGDFQVLVRAEFRSKTPVKVEYVTHRALVAR